MGISVIDFCHYILGDSADVCGKKGESEYSGIEKDKNGVFVIYKYVRLYFVSVKLYKISTE